MIVTGISIFLKVFCTLLSTFVITLLNRKAHLLNCLNTHLNNKL